MNTSVGLTRQWENSIALNTGQMEVNLGGPTMALISLTIGSRPKKNRPLTLPAGPSNDYEDFGVGLA